MFDNSGLVFHRLCPSISYKVRYHTLGSHIYLMVHAFVLLLFSHRMPQLLVKPFSVCLVQGIIEGSGFTPCDVQAVSPPSDAQFILTAAVAGAEENAIPYLRLSIKHGFDCSAERYAGHYSHVVFFRYSFWHDFLPFFSF